MFFLLISIQIIEKENQSQFNIQVQHKQIMQSHVLKILLSKSIAKNKNYPTLHSNLKLLF